MALNELTSPDAVRRAVAEFDELGRDAFLAKYGFGRSRRYFLQVDGKRYDSKAIAGAAFGFQYPERGPLSPTEFAGGEATVKPRLESFGFEVVEVGRDAGSADGEWNGQSLREEFDRFRSSVRGRFFAKARRTRAAELRALLSDPESVSLDWFNNEVWRLDSGTKVRGQPRRLDAEGLHASEDEFVDLEEALDAGLIEFHGNTMFRSATNVFGAQLRGKSDEDKLGVVREALRILNSELEPLEKVRQVQGLPSFGPNNASGLGMIFHPDSIAIYNEVSKKVLEDLRLPVASLDAFEQSAAELRESLGAEDFLELDWFIWLRAQESGDASSNASDLMTLLQQLVPEPSETDEGQLHLVVKWSARFREDVPRQEFWQGG